MNAPFIPFTALADEDVIAFEDADDNVKMRTQLKRGCKSGTDTKTI